MSLNSHYFVSYLIQPDYTVVKQPLKDHAEVDYVTPRNFKNLFLKFLGHTGTAWIPFDQTKPRSCSPFVILYFIFVIIIQWSC